MADILYLGSQSTSRQKLLELAQIPYKVIGHTSDEQPRIGVKDFKEYVLAVAHGKMRSLRLPEPSKIDAPSIFTLTADTLIKNNQTGQVYGKPFNKDHAVKMLQSMRGVPVEVVTAVCIARFSHHDGQWHRDVQEEFVSSSMIEFWVEDDMIETYFRVMPHALKCAGAGIIEEHGLTYLKHINGSFAGVIGLPLYELRQHLKNMGFVFA